MRYEFEGHLVSISRDSIVIDGWRFKDWYATARACPFCWTLLGERFTCDCDGWRDLCMKLRTMNAKPGQTEINY